MITSEDFETLKIYCVGIKHRIKLAARSLLSVTSMDVVSLVWNYIFEFLLGYKCILNPAGIPPTRVRIFYCLPQSFQGN
jgi:hypothetical protein